MTTIREDTQFVLRRILTRVHFFFERGITKEEANAAWEKARANQFTFALNEDYRHYQDTGWRVAEEEDWDQFLRWAGFEKEDTNANTTT